MPNQVQMDAESAKRVLDNITAENPQKWAPAVQTLIVSLFERVDMLERALVQAVKVVQVLANGKRVTKAAAQTEAPGAAAVESEAPVEQTTDDVAGGLTAGGEPRTAEQAAIEAQMDAAIAAEAADKGQAAPPPRARVRAVPGGRGRRPPPPQAPPPGATADDITAGLPQDPEARTAALNAMMDAMPTENQG